VEKEFWTSGIEPGTKDFKMFENGVNQKMFTATAYPGTELWNVVKPDLKKHFNIEFDQYGEPICDDNFHNYVLALDDATKILNDKDGNPVNFGEMSMDQFLQAREYVDDGKIEKILKM
jgi:hypothetical protein